MKIAGWLVLAVLVILLIAKGLVPAFTSIGTDFANYYVSSYVLVHDRQNTNRLYDAEWFGHRAQSLGGPNGAIFQPFPPPTALLMVPLTLFDIRTAKSIWTFFNLCLATGLVLILARLSILSHLQTVLILLGSGWAIINTFALGQVYLLLTFCLALSIYLYEQKREFASGVIAGLFIPIKYFPLALVVVFLIERKWNAVAGAFVSALAVLVLSVLTLGLDVHRFFLDSVLWHHLDGEMANPFSATYQSWDSLLRSLFIKDPILNPTPFLDSPAGFVFFRGSVILCLIAALILAMRRRIDRESLTVFYVSAFFTFTLLIAPATATYHFLVLSIPVAMLSPLLIRRNQIRLLGLVLLLYFGIGLVPAGGIDRIALEGIWRLLAYPRLYLLLALFLTITVLVEKETGPELPLSTTM